MMVKLFLLSILLHLVADYTLQGCLANLKQRDWWTKMIAKEVDSALGKNPSAGKYWHLFRHDYICGLVCHALSWTLVTFAPLLWLSQSASSLAWIVFANTIIHAVVDDLKCNRHAINLWQDQMLHLSQIVITFALYFNLFKGVA